MGQELRAAGLAQGRITLQDTAESVNSLHREAMQACKHGLGKAREAGKLLCIAKSAIRHGAFEAWVDHECEFSIETARGYMRIHTNWDELVERNGASRMANITFTEGLKQLAKPSKSPPQKAENGSQTTVTTPTPGDIKDVECSKGGAHEWEPDPELDGLYCAKCHERRPEDEPAADPAPAGHTSHQRGSGTQAAATDSVAPKRLADLFGRAEQLCGALVNLVDDLHKLKPCDGDRVTNMRDSLQLLYNDIKTWKSE